MHIYYYYNISLCCTVGSIIYRTHNNSIRISNKIKKIMCNKIKKELFFLKYIREIGNSHQRGDTFALYQRFNNLSGTNLSYTGTKELRLPFEAKVREH